MGDGAVVCMPSQQRDIMERFPVSEAAWGSRGFGLVPEKKMKDFERKERAQRQEERPIKEELEKGVPVTERRRKGEPGKGERRRNGELEKGEVVPERSHREKGELEKGEFALDKWRRVDLEVGEFVPDDWRKWEDEKPEHESGRSRKVELEKDELVPDKWRKGMREHSQEGYYQKKEGGSKKEGERRNLEKGELALDKWPKVDKNHANEGHHQKKEVGGRNQSEPRKRSSLKCDGNVTDRRNESGSHKHELNNGKGRLKDHNSTSSLKRHCVESDSSTRKHHGEHSDNLGSKSRRISEDSNSRQGYQDKSHNFSTAPTRNSSMNRYSSSRHHESPLPSRGHDRHLQKPGLEQTPYDRTHQHHHRDRSPIYSERSPLDRVRHHERRDRTPACSERSPHERLRHHDHRDRTPGRRDRSPHDRARLHDHRDRTPGNLERSPHNTGQVRESGWKGASGEKQLGRYEEKPGRRDPDGRDSVKHSSSVRQSSNTATCPDKIATCKPNKEKESHNSVAYPNELPPPPPFSPPPLPPPPPPANGFPEDSMEEDMDICDTPPHAVVPVEQNIGKWYYLDNYGLERGPSKLTNLKRLVEEGVLPSDHLIKHVDSDRWVTVENATSPLLCVSLTSVVSDVLTQMVSPPEASGNLLVDDGDITVDQSLSMLQPELCPKHDCVLPAALGDLHIDERIDALLNGYDIIPGRELEILGEALKVTFEHVEWENWSHSEGFTRSRAHTFEAPKQPREDATGRVSDGMSKEGVETRFVATSDKELAFLNSDSTDCFAGLWSCKGGDWKRNDDNVHDRNQKRKLVLNEGYPLCQMPKCGDEDPRWQRRDDLYYPSRNKIFDVPSWAFSWMEEKNENSNDSSKCMLAGRSNQVKPVVSRGVKGVLLPVVRINACVIRDQDTVSESRPRTKSVERLSSRSVRPHNGNDDKSSFPEGSYRSRKVYQHDSSQKYKESVNIPKDHVCTVDELSTHLGDWFYLDAAGHEHGPFLLSELQDLVAKGTILKHSSVFRKVDNVWIPITESTITTEVACSIKEKGPAAYRPFFDSVSHNHMNAATFHSLHPQFIGYTRGKLHELVMKSFKSREFAAAINEVLDPWITAKQPKKELEKHFTFNSSITKSSVVLSHDSSSDQLWRAEGDAVGIYGHGGKRARLMLDESDEDFELEDDLPTSQKNDSSFEDLFGEDASNEENCMSSERDSSSWGLLNDRILARVFHFLRADAKSLVLTAATCKHWRAAVKFYWSMSKQVDLLHLGSSCTDSMFQSIMSGCDKSRITSIILSRCSNISATALEEILHVFPGISCIDIRGCNQFRELMPLFQNVKWIKNHSSLNAKNLEESHSKTKSLKRITDKGFLSSKTSKESISHLDDLGNSTNLNVHVFHLDQEDSVTHTFRQGYYKRTRLPDARKSSAALSRDAQLRQLLRKKSVTAYRKMEGFIGMKLKEIMKENTFEFFLPRVAEIEEKMRNGRYSRLGLSSVKEDISRMCRDALKMKRQGESGDLKQVVMSFFQLAKNLENSKMPNGRDDMVKSLRDSLDAGFSSEFPKHRKKNNRNMNDKRLNNRTNNIAYANGGVDYEPYEIDREFKRSISKPNRRHMDTESETSEENDLTEDDMMSGIDGTTSGTDSELDIHLESRKDDGKDGHLVWDDSLDSISDDREWGARMTKSSLVPPVTRKYEVIDKYIVVADEEEVKRKMTVALPEDYDEKVRAQKSGLEESDMEIPEVKDYKPRKMLGVEVIEQEVYGIDPYTHNLLLDSMPDEADWPLVEKQKFIEEVLLRSLNKKVRHFTGSGNTPMVFHLKSVVEEIKRTAEESAEARIVKLCHAILKAMQSRPDDNYVAYRKGLGVVCNKEGGFGEDDFVVEFLGEVYPAWKWFEKQDGIRSLQKNSKDPAPEFYNIYLERPKGDRDGYDLVVVDAMHKANYASRICHSCRPNCEAKVTAVNGQYQIGIYTVRPIAYGEEITFDYNSVTESKEEYEASVCLCGSQVCRGSYLNLTGEDAFQNVLKECHGLLDRHKLMLEACEKNYVSQEDYIDLAKAGLGPCLLAGLPDWLITYSAHLVRFVNLERTKLPEQILKHNLEEKRKIFTDICLEAEKNDAEVQAEGVYNQRLQNLALTLDKVRYVMRRVFGDPKEAPPPLERLSPDQLVSALWKGEGSLVEELLQCMAPHLDVDVLNDLKSKIRDHVPSGPNLQMELRKSLLWLRDELRNFPCSYKCRNDAAADLIHIYAYTKCFFRVREYKTVTSPPVYISPLDLGPKYVDKMGSGFQEYCKTYGENYCLGQLIYWHNQANADPDCNLARARRGCLTIPDIGSFYTKSQKPPRERIYSLRTLRFMLARMEKQPQRPWPKDQVWVFSSAPRFFGSPMMDAVLNNCPLDKEMVHWLKSRPSVFEAMWDG